jgi:vitamin B12 transporter
MSSSRLVAFCAALCAFNLAAAAAEEPPAPLADEAAATALDPIVTTATRAPRPASELLAPVIVIDRSTIERSLAADLSDLLRNYAGIDIARSGGPGQTSSAFLRGTESNHVLLLVDGIELNPGTIGGAPFAVVPLAAIERIEVVFGPRAVLYGSEAIGGVINLITKRGAARAALQAGASAGAQDTSQAHFGGGFANGELDGSLDLERFVTGGYVIQPAVPVARGNDRDSLSANLGWHAGLWQARVARFQVRGTQEYNDFILTPVSQSFEDSTTALTLARDSGVWRSTLIYARYHDRIEQDQPNPFTAAVDYVDTARETADWQNDLVLGKHAVTLGAYWADEATAAESFGAYTETSRVVAAYASDSISIGAHSVELGVRQTDHSTAGHHTSWDAEYGYALSDATRVVVTAGAGFRAPDSADRYTPCCGNPALRPELAQSYEVALLRRPSARDAFRFAAFHTDIEDLISFGPSFVLENIDRARIDGVEASWQHTDQVWDAEVRAVLLDTEDLATGAELPRRADQTLTARLARRAGAFVFGADALATGARKDSSFSTTVLPGYALLDLHARWQAGERWALRARLENALDKDYVTAGGYANPGLSLFLGVDWTL